ncbi:hypothetical protein OG933_17945 [Streptomyces sp. NBC_00016]|uniref:hypothetical protein n=1 Tax=Streptomyces sp. NBC_00016 TaxID=2975622 RepID=UPI00324A04C3
MSKQKKTKTEKLDDAATAILTKNGWVDQMVPESKRNEDSSPVCASADWLAGGIEDFLDLNLTNTGFTIQGEARSTEVIHYCQWRDAAGACMEELYGPSERRGRGRPRKWCPKHQRPAKSRTESLRAAGISIETHRNLSYRPKSEVVVSLPVPEFLRGLVSDRTVCLTADKAKWISKPSNDSGSNVDQYEQNRAVWRSGNLPRRVR